MTIVMMPPPPYHPPPLPPPPPPPPALCTSDIVHVTRMNVNTLGGLGYIDGGVNTQQPPIHSEFLGDFTY